MLLIAAPQIEEMAMTAMQLRGLRERLRNSTSRVGEDARLLTVALSRGFLVSAVLDCVAMRHVSLIIGIIRLRSCVLV
jgi:hypothetical protein